MNAIVLVVDRWHVGYLGCYGNSWIATPAIDRLASQSVLFDQAILESPRLTDFYRNCWSGASALSAKSNVAADRLPIVARERGVQTALVSDNIKLAEDRLAQDWQTVIASPPPGPPRRALDVQSCQFARTFATAADWLSGAEEPFLLWVHLRGFGGAWDAPLEFRARYFEDEELKVPKLLKPPQLRLADDFDPDELLKLRWSYAGQVSLFDACLGEFLELIDTPELLANTLVILLSPRGYPLGEHRQVGSSGKGASQPLHAEMTHLPWLMRWPGQEHAAVRSQALVQPADMWATLLEHWFERSAPVVGFGRSLMPLVRGEAEEVRDHVLLMSGKQEHAIRTPGWHLRLCQSPGGDRTRKLFVKPDDRWEMNEVADRCPDVAERLEQVIAAGLQQAAKGNYGPYPPLDETLLIGPA